MMSALGVVAPAPASDPKTIRSKVLLSDLLSNCVITIGFWIVTCAPFLTAVFATAAQASPPAVFSRR